MLRTLHDLSPICGRSLTWVVSNPQVGKLLIFKSGAVKLQMGEVLLDVSLGSSCGFRQDLAATNVVGGAAPTGHFLQLGKVESRLVCSPDISQLLKYGFPSFWCMPPVYGLPLITPKY